MKFFARTTKIPKRGCVEDQPQRICDVQAAATGFQHRSRSGGYGFAALVSLLFIRGFLLHR